MRERHHFRMDRVLLTALSFPLPPPPLPDSAFSALGWGPHGQLGSFLSSYFFVLFFLSSMTAGLCLANLITAGPHPPFSPVLSFSFLNYCFHAVLVSHQAKRQGKPRRLIPTRYARPLFGYFAKPGIRPWTRIWLYTV
ncbi:hypothetical protein F4811DRAFT_530423 [Daldinia bambusicola]|nr:hypothetical protein F4811DRAFT_530423 [Daldinia bambusicola]